ncbi:FAD binding domain-containing protein [Camelliibacillus cellulosilyticus]|uniref:FAD binding domain-containing protein n=1 Tax=Camelliibacillus cellulosilyticus TaxID=2174486 RepID=A0ABV9GPP4_9BACL
MIPSDFVYFKPKSFEEALVVYYRIAAAGGAPYFYGGGTDIISLARRNKIRPDVVIDIKGIPECRQFYTDQDRIIIGAATVLNRIVTSAAYPLLSTVCREIADHTNRNRITLGGALCGGRVYKEAALPFLLGDGEALIADSAGIHRVSAKMLLNGKARWPSNVLLLQLFIERDAVRAPYFFKKRTRNSKVDYPLVSVAGLQKDGKARIAVSGVCPYPFRSEAMEEVLNDSNLSPPTRARHALEHLPGAVLNDFRGSAEYRLFVLEDLLLRVMAHEEGGKVDE